MSDDQIVPGLSEPVIDRLRSERGDSADKIVACLRTAEELLVRVVAGDDRLRLAESAAYNLREALNTVVEGQDAAHGGLRAVIDAWSRYETEVSQPQADSATAREALDDVIRKVAADESRASNYTRRFISYLGDRSGISQLPGHVDPASEYGDLRDEASRALHSAVAVADARALLDRTVAWFVRVFSPPDEIVDAIRNLATQPWQSASQTANLARLITNDHHLRLFFSEVTDPGWLQPVHRAGLARLPAQGAPWPVAGILDGLARTDPHSAASLLDSLLTDTKSLSKTDDRTLARLELLRVAAELGPAGHHLVADVVRQHGDISAARVLGAAVALKAEPADAVVQQVAEIVLNNLNRFPRGDNYYAIKLLNHLQAGITEGNVDARARMLAGKLRRRSRLEEARYVDLGIEPLTVDVGERPEPLLLLAHHVARVLSTARAFGVPTSTQKEWLGELPGELSERIYCQIMAGADDVSLADKIAHIADRLASRTATGDDLTLVADIESYSPAIKELSVWSEALGSPSPASTEDADQIPWDWARAWRWAAVLPDHVFSAWREPIAFVTKRHGAPDPLALTRTRRPVFAGRFGTSPHSPDELAALPVLEAARIVAAWRADVGDGSEFGVLELARALETTVKNDPAGWSADPSAVVATLDKPIYVEHYFRGLTERAADIISRAAAVLAAAARALALASAARINEGSSTLAGDEFNRTHTRETILDLIRALANNEADIADNLDDLWDWTLTDIHEFPEANSKPPFTDDPLNSAINRLWGHGLQTVLALAAWEFRRNGTIRAAFEGTLDSVIQTPGTVGLELRAILASHIGLLEVIAQPWLDTHANALLRDGPLAQQTFDLAIKWARPTAWTYQNFKTELFDAAIRGTENAATKIAIAVLNEVDGYDFATVIRHLRNHAATLAVVAEEATFQVQDLDADSPFLANAVEFWTQLLDADQGVVPERALFGLGRWAFVTGLSDDKWAELTARTLQATNGRIGDAISVANRAGDLPLSPRNQQIVLQLLDNGEAWERHHAALKAIKMLRASTRGPVDDTFWRLRTRLIDLGYHQASDVRPCKDH